MSIRISAILTEDFRGSSQSLSIAACRILLKPPFKIILSFDAL
jgi:hypothetical protein